MDARPTSVAQTFDRILDAVREAAVEVYGSRLVSLAVFGSVGRRSPRPDSDIDLLVVADPLPDGRIPRVREFDQVEDRVRSMLEEARGAGVHTRLSPVFKTPREVRRRSLLLLDLVEDARMLVDRDDFLAGELESFRQRLEELGARRIWRGSAWYWDLKPDYVPGEEFAL